MLVVASERKVFVRFHFLDAQDRRPIAVDRELERVVEFVEDGEFGIASEIAWRDRRLSECTMKNCKRCSETPHTAVIRSHSQTCRGGSVHPLRELKAG